MYSKKRLRTEIQAIWLKTGRQFIKKMVKNKEKAGQ